MTLVAFYHEPVMFSINSRQDPIEIHNREIRLAAVTNEKIAAFLTGQDAAAFSNGVKRWSRNQVTFGGWPRMSPGLAEYSEGW